MSTANYPDTVTAAEEHSVQVAKRGRAAWLGAAPAIYAGRNMDGNLLPEDLIFTAALFGAVALWSGRDVRERLTGILTAVPVLAIGMPAMRLLSAGWALLAILAAFAAAGAAFAAWQHCRTPRAAATPKPEPSTPKVEPSRPMLSPVPGRCRWCGLRPRAAICGKRSDGGVCEEARQVQA